MRRSDWSKGGKGEGGKGEGASVADHELIAPFLTKPGFLLARIDQICTAIFASLTDVVTLNQAEFLLLLDRLGPMIQIDLAKAAGVDKSTTAFILDNLQARGWIERRVNEADRRSSLVALTISGEAGMPTVRRAFAKLQAELEGSIDPIRLPLLIATLYRLGSDPEGRAPLWRTACEPDAGVLDRSLSFLSRRALQSLQAQFMATAREASLTLRQFSLLFILSRRKTITQIEFARIFGVDPATCAVIMRSLTRRGLLSSAPCERDRRARLYELTPAGHGQLRRIQPLVDCSEQTVFRAETSASRDEAVRQLYAIAKAHSHLLRFPGVIASR